MAHSGDWAPRRARGVIETVSTDDDVLLVDPHGSALLRLNQTARAIWELCDGNTRLDEMVDACVSLFDIREQRARQDVSTALEDLERAGVVK